jgi:magnesium transporter
VLVNCAAYRDGRKVSDVPVDEIHRYAEMPETFVWVALKDPSAEELEKMQTQFDLHGLAVEDATHGHQRPKIDEYGNMLFAVLHVIEPEGDEFKVGEVDVFVGPDYVLSVRRDVDRGFTDVRARCEREPELLVHGPVYVLYALMDAVVDRYLPLVASLETEIEAIEDKIFSNLTTRANVEDLYTLKQRLMTVKHSAEPLLQETGKLFGGRVPQMCIPLQDYFRDICDHLVRLVQWIDGLREMVTTAISVNLTLITMQETEVTKRLAAYAALVAIPTLIAGIYGMNFRHMPEISWVFGYPLALMLMVGLDAWLFFRFRKANWL